MGHFDGVGEPIPKMIRDAGRKDLGFIFKASKSPRMDDTVAIALELTAVSMPQFGISPAAASLDWKTQAAEPANRRRIHFCGRELAKVMAALLTALRVLVRSGSTSFLARCGSLVLIRSASAKMAASFETNTVG